MAQTLDAKHPGTNLTEGENYIAAKSAAFTLGPNGTSPLELSSAYATIANDGKYCPPTPLLKVVGPDGKQIGLPERACEQRDQPRDRAHRRHRAREGHQQERRYGGQRVRRARRRVPADRRQDRHRVRIQAR